MSYLFYVVPLIQIITAVHVIKTGRDWYWLWIILFFPMLGAAIYFLVEIMPSLRLSRRSFESLTDRVMSLAIPGRELEQLQARVELVDSVENRRELAQGYLRARLPEKAVALYQSCLEGVFSDDAEITLELGYALFLAGQFEECKHMLEKLRQGHPGYEAPLRELISARAHENLGRETEALGIYENLVKNYRGEEARCRYAQLLEKTGDIQKAKALYEDIVKRAKRQGHHYRKLNRQWIGLAKEGMRRLEGR